MTALSVVRQDLPTHADKVTVVDSGCLAEAFASFTHAAGSLQSSYGTLQAELARLRSELGNKNRDLARSHAENTAMRAFLDRILEGLPCGVLVVDRGFSVRFANSAARRLLGYDRCAVLAGSLAVPLTLRCLLEGILVEDPETERTWCPEGEGGLRSIGVTCAWLPEDPSSAGDLAFILRDITEQKRLQEERELARRMRALADMTAVLAHEIRNPLGSLELFAGLIKDATQDQPEVAQWVIHVQAGLRALSATVNNVLHFHAQAVPQAAPTNVSTLLADTVEFLRPLALQRSMGIVLKGAPKEAWIAADPQRLQQVFFNLATNAFRAMSVGGSLTIRI
ncbi:MAG TPA: histidine kinase dimerization/phospho-acceptor domain-containing protein, partial [Candidatus Methylomirabilis sp.]|nr:histidine kinase dimerization/phospho-acceptor domain-containing protein [Candidatus Methylomirabilis sp.]